LSSAFVPADASFAVTGILELRTADGSRADFFDHTRVTPWVHIDGRDVPTTSLIRRAPGVWSFQFSAAPGEGGKVAIVGAFFDGRPIVSSKVVPVATDPWNAKYPSIAVGGCAIARPSPLDGSGRAFLAAAAASITRRRSRRRPRFDLME
jgi:hypothetical protein